MGSQGRAKMHFGHFREVFGAVFDDKLTRDGVHGCGGPFWKAHLELLPEDP